MANRQTQRALEDQWDLFEDWCASWNRDPMATTAEIVAQFLAAFSGALSTQGLRVRAIRRRYEQAGVPLDLTGIGRKPSVLWRDEARFIGVGEAIGQLPAFRFPVGLRGRRDAFVLLLAEAGFTRRRIHDATPSQVTISTEEILVGEKQIQTSEDPGGCLRCAATRWLQILGPASAGDRAQVRDVLDVRNAVPGVHDCAARIDRGWLRAEHLVVSLDTHGWVRPGTGLSVRSISALVSPHRAPTGYREDTAYVAPTGGRYATLSGAELYGIQDAVDSKIAAALLQSAELLDEATRIVRVLGVSANGT